MVEGGKGDTIVVTLLDNTNKLPVTVDIKMQYCVSNLALKFTTQKRILMKIQLKVIQRMIKIQNLRPFNQFIIFFQYFVYIHDQHIFQGFFCNKFFFTLLNFLSKPHLEFFVVSFGLFPFFIIYIYMTFNPISLNFDGLTTLFSL